MAKDPAFLFYPNDWLGGTANMTPAEKGCYMDLLVAQFNRGSLSEKDVRIILGSNFRKCWPAIQPKFKVDDNGLFFNSRLREELEKRKKHSELQKARIDAYWKEKKAILGNTKTQTKHDTGSVPLEDENENLLFTQFTHGGLDAREEFFLRLPESVQFSRAAKDLGMQPVDLQARIPEFRKACKTEYPSFFALVDHFKNWVRVNPNKPQQNTGMVF